MKIKKKYYVGVAMTLGITLSLTLVSGVAFAKQQEKQNNPIVQTKQDEKSSSRSSKKQTQKEYDKEQLEGYLTGAGFTDEDNLKISQKFSLDENTEVSYVFAGDEVIGSYTTTEVDGEKLSSFTFDSTSDEIQSIYETSSDFQEQINSGISEPDSESSDEVSYVNDLVKEAYKKGQKIAFKNANKGKVFFHGKKANYISGENQGKEYSENNNSLDTQEKIDLEKIEMPLTANIGSANYFVGTFNTKNDKWFHYYADGHVDKDQWGNVIGNLDFYNQNKAFYDIKIDCNTRTSDGIKTMYNNNNLSNYYFCPCPLRANYGWDSKNKKGWEKLKGRQAAGGICWCATCASILTYKGMSYTTKGLYNCLDDAYYTIKNTIKIRPSIFADYFTYQDLVVPGSEHGWYKYALNFIGGLNYKYWDKTKLSLSTVENNIKNGYPIFLAVSKGQITKNGTIITKGQGHAINLCGTYKLKSNNTTYYVYMDCNNSDGYTVNSVPNVLRDTINSKRFYFIPDGYGTDKDYYYNEWLFTYSRYI